MTTGRINQVATLVDARSATAPQLGVPWRGRMRLPIRKPTERRAHRGAHARPTASSASESTCGRRGPDPPGGRGRTATAHAPAARRSQRPQGPGASGREEQSPTRASSTNRARGRRHRQPRRAPWTSIRIAPGPTAKRRESPGGWLQHPAGSPRGHQHRAPLTCHRNRTGRRGRGGNRRAIQPLVTHQGIEHGPIPTHAAPQDAC